jgi:hypothetical protein
MNMRVARSSLYLLLAFNVAKVQAQTNLEPEYKFKAVYLYNFLQFIEWPPQAFQGESWPIVVGVVGNDAFSGMLEQTVKDETIRDRPVIVRRISGVEETKACHVLFIAKGEEKNLHDILSKIKGKPILTVSETVEFVRQGGAINFYLEGNKLRFEVNLSAVKAANLVVSSKLLRLARIVEPANR